MEINHSVFRIPYILMMTPTAKENHRDKMEYKLHHCNEDNMKLKHHSGITSTKLNIPR
jgi:hypothetical protein